MKTRASFLPNGTQGRGGEGPLGRVERQELWTGKKSFSCSDDKTRGERGRQTAQKCPFPGVWGRSRRTQVGMCSRTRQREHQDGRSKAEANNVSHN